MKLSVTVVCDALLIWPVLLSECKKKEKELKGSRMGVKNLGIPSSGRRPRWGPLFAFLPLIHRPVCAVVLFLVFLEGEMSLLIQVVWAGACARLQEQTKPAPRWADFDPISNICPLSLVERMPSYANFYTRSVEPFNMHLCFLSFYVNLKSPFILLNIQASWCQTCWLGVNGSGNFLHVTCFKTETSFIWLMHHAECWDPSVCEGSKVNPVLDV